MNSQMTFGLGLALPIALVLLLGFWLLFRQRPAERLLALRSMVLMFLTFMIVQFMYLVFHEGGHSLNAVWRGVPVTLYVHPFFFAGFSRPAVDVTNVWPHILGSGTSIPLALLISLLSWKRRSPALLPLAMLFPWVALGDGINITGVMGGMSGDFNNVVLLTGLPAALFVTLGVLIFCIGVLSLLSLFPLAGLSPHDHKALFVIPGAMFLISMLSFVVAQSFVPGSLIDREYALGPDILLTATFSILLYPIVGLILAVLYVTLCRKISPQLPAWLRTETVDLAWKDFRLPGILWAISIALGLIIVI